MNMNTRLYNIQFNQAKGKRAFLSTVPFSYAKAREKIQAMKKCKYRRALNIVRVF